MHGFSYSVLLCFLTLKLCNAATYYIDYSSGSDANSPTSKTAPWKRHPYMKGFTGTYAHSPGDHFVFKGGVTWSNEAFQLHITHGGTSDSVRDVYTVDKTWYSGSSWTYPLFDFESKLISSGYNAAAGIWVDTADYITFEYLEMARHLSPLGSAAYGAFVVNIFSSSYITVQNCYIHDWSLVTPVTSNSDGGGAVVNSYGGNGGYRVLNNTFHQTNASPKSTGAAIHLGGNIGFNHIYDTCNAILGGGDIHHNHIHDLLPPADPLSHCNAIETFSHSNIFNNLIHDLDGHSAPILASADWSGGYGIDLIYNNVIFAAGVQVPIVVDTGGANPGKSGGRVFNNIIEHDRAVETARRPASPPYYTYSTLEVFNNIIISTVGSSSICYNNEAAGCGNVNFTDVRNNLVLTPTQASAAGLSASNYFRPTSSAYPGIDGGLDLSAYFTVDFDGVTRPQGGKWDIGAYEYGGTPAGSGVPTGTLPSSTSTGNGGNGAVNGVCGATKFTCSLGTATTMETSPAAYTWKCAGTQGGNTASCVVQIGFTFAASSGSVVAPFQLIGDSVFQDTNTLDPTQAGSLSFTFSVAVADSYIVVGKVNCSNSGSNSFFVNMDSSPTTDNIWHAAVTTGFEDRTVSWGGNTEGGNPPHLFQLSQGTHTLIIKGREFYAYVKQMSLVSYTNSQTTTSGPVGDQLSAATTVHSWPVGIVLFFILCTVLLGK